VENYISARELSNLEWYSLLGQVFDLLCSVVAIALGIFTLYQNGFWIFLFTLGSVPSQDAIEDAINKIILGDSLPDFRIMLMLGYFLAFHLRRFFTNVPKPNHRGEFSSVTLQTLISIVQDLLVIIMIFSARSLSYMYLTIVLLVMHVQPLARRAVLFAKTYLGEFVMDDVVCMVTDAYRMSLLLLARQKFKYSTGDSYDFLVSLLIIAVTGALINQMRMFVNQGVPRRFWQNLK